MSQGEGSSGTKLSHFMKFNSLLSCNFVFCSSIKSNKTFSVKTVLVNSSQVFLIYPMTFLFPIRVWMKSLAVLAESYNLKQKSDFELVGYSLSSLSKERSKSQTGQK